MFNKILALIMCFHTLYATASLEAQDLEFKHVIQSVASDGSLVTLDDGMAFSINWWHKSTAKKWKSKDSIFIVYDVKEKQFNLTHETLSSHAWTTLKANPSKTTTIHAFFQDGPNSNKSTAIELSDGYVFTTQVNVSKWKVKSQVVIFANQDGTYQLWNRSINSIIPCAFLGKGKAIRNMAINLNEILSLEERLNSKVLQQSNACYAVSRSLLIYAAGMKDKQKPIAVFLFLGPTGVGKTELAKALTKEIYKLPTSLIRFDMSHFTEPHATSRMIGAPPGYHNHADGGQLTKPLEMNPYSLVLLDELEKAHLQVQKLFLPIFDEGFVLDNKNKRIDCTDSIFIMTSNLCGPEIASLYNQGYSEEDVLAIIEPKLMAALSPELYNRVEPILFRPLKKETMGTLTDLMLTQLCEKMRNEQSIHLTIDNSLREYLITNGYHPTLGARPLKKLIEKTISGTLASFIIENGIEGGGNMTLSYEPKSDNIKIQMLPI